MAPYTGVKYNAKDTCIYWLPSTGGTVDLTGDSRDLSIGEQANDIDVTTRGNAQMDARDYLTDSPERTWQLQSLDTRGTAQGWHQLSIGDTGTLRWYDEGTATGKRMEQAAATVQQRNRTYPYNNATTIDLQGKLTSAITQTLVT
jgi:hypothetical protein